MGASSSCCHRKNRSSRPWGTPAAMTIAPVFREELPRSSQCGGCFIRQGDRACSPHRRLGGGKLPALRIDHQQDVSGGDLDPELAPYRILYRGSDQRRNPGSNRCAADGEQYDPDNGDAEGREGKRHQAREQAGTTPDGRTAQGRRHEIGGHILELVVDGIEFDIRACDERKIVVVETRGAGGGEGAFGRSQVGGAEDVTCTHDAGSVEDPAHRLLLSGLCVREEPGGGKWSRLTAPCTPMPTRLSPMLPLESIQCPYCGETIDLVIDDSVDQQQYVEDCHVCCRPINIAVAVQEDGSIVVQAWAENDV